jgi:hypothetical protein
VNVVHRVTGRTDFLVDLVPATNAISDMSIRLFTCSLVDEKALIGASQRDRHKGDSRRMVVRDPELVKVPGIVGRMESVVCS